MLNSLRDRSCGARERHFIGHKDAKLGGTLGSDKIIADRSQAFAGQRLRIFGQAAVSSGRLPQRLVTCFGRAATHRHQRGALIAFDGTDIELWARRYRQSPWKGSFFATGR
jgi:hypothetical protein